MKLTKSLAEDVANQYDREVKITTLPNEFYYETVNSKGDLVFEISRVRFIDFLEAHGFCKFYLNEDNPVYIRIQSNIIEKSGVKQIQDFVKEYIDGLPDKLPKTMLTRDNLKERIFKAPNVFFADNYLSFLKSVDLETEPKLKDKGFFYFKNGFVEVDGNGWVLKEYDDLSWMIWASQIKDFEISIDKKDLFKRCEFAEFLRCISRIKYSGMDDDFSEEEIERKDKERFKSIVSITGFMLHKYKSPSKRKAVVIFDQNISANPEGGTGKGLFFRGISKIKNTVIYDGKNFNFDKPFLWQSVDLDTDIVFLEDVNKKFDFERLFSIITDGLTSERKNQGEIKRSAEESPNFGITTNYDLQGEGDSHERRKINFELGKFFGNSYTPEMHFGHELFNDWKYDQWNVFYNFMCNCLKYYLSTGVVTSEPLLLARKTLINQVPMEFTDFIEEFLENKLVGEFFSTSEIIQAFQLKYKDSEKVSAHLFGRWCPLINKYAGFSKILVEDRKIHNGTRQRGYWIKDSNDA